jgi:FkbM family methyltransferase
MFGQSSTHVGKRINFIENKIDLSNIKEILDIGSWHLGQSLEFHYIFPEATINAFEPVPDSYQLCLDNNSFPNKIFVHNLALTNFNGETKFYAVDPIKSSHPNVGASSLLKFMDGLNGSFFNQKWIQNEIVVKCSTLDNWCQIYNKKIDIIWIDVQGAELQVFKGGSKTLDDVKIIFTEVGLKPYYEGHSLKKDIDEYLNNKGFVEITESFELNGFDYEANTIYCKKYLLNEKIGNI